MLTRYEMPAPQSEMEQCDTLRYNWERLQALATKVSNHLLEVQPGFKDDLIQDVTVFNQDCKDFYKNYEDVCSSFITVKKNFKKEESVLISIWLSSS